MTGMCFVALRSWCLVEERGMWKPLSQCEEVKEDGRGAGVSRLGVGGGLLFTTPPTTTTLGQVFRDPAEMVVFDLPCQLIFWCIWIDRQRHGMSKGGGLEIPGVGITFFYHLPLAGGAGVPTVGEAEKQEKYRC